jgi:hypothetical protein
MKTRILLALVLLALAIPSSSAQSVPTNASFNSDGADALAYLGCKPSAYYGAPELTIQASVTEAVQIGLTYWLIDEGLITSIQEPLDTRWGRDKYQLLIESWAIAGHLSSKYRSLETNYNKGISAGSKKWSSDENLTNAINAASAVSVSKLTAVCKVAEVAVRSKAGKSRLTIRNYLKKVAGRYVFLN